MLDDHLLFNKHHLTFRFPATEMGYRDLHAAKSRYRILEMLSITLNVVIPVHK